MAKLVTLTDPQSLASEAYRTLRTNLSFYSVDHPIKTLLCASAEPNDEKSITVANLAVTIANGGSRTILVDCDLRKSAVHTIFGLPNEVGLTEAILDEKLPLPLQKTEVANLRVMTSGKKPPNPADLLGSRKTDALIERLKQEADIIIFDAPPIVPVSDGVIFGAKVDGVLLILEAGKSRRDYAERAKTILQQARVRIVGATLINAPRSESIEGYY